MNNNRMADIDALDALIENGSVHPKFHIGTAGWIWIFLAIATIALGAGFAFIPGIVARIQL